MAAPRACPRRTPRARCSTAGPAVVLLTRGADGARRDRRASGESAVAGAAVDVVDTIGAGDAFSGGWLRLVVRARPRPRRAGRRRRAWSPRPRFACLVAALHLRARRRLAAAPRGARGTLRVSALTLAGRCHNFSPLWSINGKMGQESDDPAGVSVSFNEELAGYIDFDETGYDAAFRAGETAGRRLTLRLAITADDVVRSVAQGRATARVTGWVRGGALGGPLEVERGELHLAIGADGVRRMDYRLRFHDGADRPITLAGLKEVRRELADAPPALYTRLLAGHVEAADEPAAAVLATGILEVHPDELARQLSSFRVSPPLRLDALARFGVLFAGDLWHTYR